MSKRKQAWASWIVTTAFITMTLGVVWLAIHAMDEGRVSHLVGVVTTVAFALVWLRLSDFCQHCLARK